jgi:type IV pilus assembly protein PilA
MKKNQQGFSLIELLIVVVIIGIIAAIAIPNLLASRRAANEGSAISALRTLNGANSTFYATKGKNKYFAYTPEDLKGQELIDSALLDAFRGNPKSGYLLTYAPTITNSGPTTMAPVTSYTVNADPTNGDYTTATRTGSRGFFVDQSGVIREKDGLAAGAGDNAIGQ